MVFLDLASRFQRTGERKVAKKEQQKRKRKRAGELADPKTLTPRTHLAAAAAAMADGGGEGGPPAASAALKDQGNEQFKAGSYLKAAALYTQAIKLDPDNATLYRFLPAPPLLFFLRRAGGKNPSCACAHPAFGEAMDSCGLGVSNTRGVGDEEPCAPTACVITDQCLTPAV